MKDSPEDKYNWPAAQSEIVEFPGEGASEEQDVQMRLCLMDTKSVYVCLENYKKIQPEHIE